MSPKMVPRVNARDAVFWEGCRDGVLHVMRCEECGECWFPPQDRCPACRSEKIGWQATEPSGTLYTYTVVYGSGPEGRPDLFDYPYAVGVIEVDGGAGARIPGPLGIPFDGIRIGMRVEARFEGEVALPTFVPATSEAAGETRR